MSRHAIILILGCILSLNAEARPEYAVKEKQNCFACHVVPWGGGPRNIFGKTYGSHGNAPAKTSTQDLFYGDVRFIGYYPDHAQATANGTTLMEAAVSGNAAITENPNGNEMRAVLTWNLAPLSGAYARDAFVRWQVHAGPDETPVHFMLGRFTMPFGLATDEHRTYTRMQTNSTFNNFNVGFGVSGDPLPGLHADLVLVNDFQNSAGFTQKDLTWGSVANLRWNPASLPFFLGVSANFERTQDYSHPYASSLYGALSVDRLTNGSVSGSLLFERVDAANWNNPALNTGGINNMPPAAFFIPQSDPLYLASVTDASSVGYYGQAKYNLNPMFTFFYKFDYLALNRNFLDDAYVRHGLGVETYLNSNMILNVRFEKAFGMRPEIIGSGVLASQDDVFAMLRVWL